MRLAATLLRPGVDQAGAEAGLKLLLAEMLDSALEAGDDASARATVCQEWCECFEFTPYETATLVATVEAEWARVSHLEQSARAARHQRTRSLLQALALREKF